MKSGKAASLTAIMNESFMIKATIDAKQRRHVMMADIPNAFLQVDIGKKG
jgi:hypothetical protein